VVPAFYLKVLLMALLLLFAPVPARALWNGTAKAMPNLSTKPSDYYWLDGICTSVWERKAETLVGEAESTRFRKSPDEVTSCLMKGFTLQRPF
jgi:hypothetical protein